MKKIAFIGGAVMKTPARQMLFEVLDDVEILCLNGGALFHDFQMALEGFTSVPLEELNKSLERIEKSCIRVVAWAEGRIVAPKGSIVAKCHEMGIDVLLFTSLVCDYWPLYSGNWGYLEKVAKADFSFLHSRFLKSRFHYLNICSAVIGPEVFQKAIQGVPEEHIRADAVDFLDMYRPRTRVAKYGVYYKMEVSEYMKRWKANLSEGNQ